MKSANLKLISILIVLGVISFFGAKSASAAIGTVPTTGLIGHWALDDGSGTNAADSSGSGNNGTTSGSPTWGTGIAGGDLNFTGTNTVSFPAGLQNSSFPKSGALTFWLYGDFSAQAQKCIFDCWSARNHIYVRTYSGSLQIMFQDAVGYINTMATTTKYVNSALATDAGTFPITANTWTHFAVVWDTLNQMGYIYVNGTIASSFWWGKYSTSWAPNAQTFSIGNATAGFTGAIDDVALYNRPLSADEVATIYAGSAAPAFDSQAPSVPPNFAGSTFGSTRTVLGWDASSDSSSIGGYVVYRDGLPAGEASSTELSFYNSGLATSSAHSYQIYAFDEYGNKSASTSVVNVGTTGSSTLLHADFEADSTDFNADIGGFNQSSPKGQDIQVTTEQARSGSKSVKFSFDYADWNHSIDNDKRAEITETDRTQLQLGKTYWVGFSEYVPTTWQDDYAANAELIWQFHGWETGPAGLSSPPLAYYVGGSTSRISVRGDPTTYYATAPSETVLKTFDFDADKGKWIDWVMQIRFNFSNGLVRVWKNGIKVVDYSGPTIYHQTGETDQNGPYLHLGVYKWGWGDSATQVTNRTLYADEARIGDETAGCDGVRPKGSKSCSPIKLGAPQNFLTLGGGLVGWWTFDGNDLKQNAVDKSGNGNTGYLMSFSTTSAAVAGQIGQALLFNGTSNYVSLPNFSSILNLKSATPSSFTISGWFYPKSSPVDLSGIQLMTGSARLVIRSSNNKFLFQLLSGGTQDQANDACPANKWCHVVGVFDSSQPMMTVYVNGSYSNQALPSSVDLSTTNTTSQIIGLGNGSSGYFNGSMDDVRVYNRAISATEVKELYNMGSSLKAAKSQTVNGSGLVGWWTFDGNDLKQNAADKSGSGNTGYMIGFTSTSSAQVSGKVGQAIKFNGATSCIDAGKPSSLNIIGAISISAWIKPPDSVASQIAGKQTLAGGSSAMQYILATQPGNRFVWQVQNAALSPVLGITSDTNQYPYGKWYHLVGVYDGVQTATLYVNGAYYNSATSAGYGALNDSGKDFLIGGTHGSTVCNGSYFDGSIDDVRVYNRALSADEVKRLYQAGR